MKSKTLSNRNRKSKKKQKNIVKSTWKITKSRLPSDNPGQNIVAVKSLEANFYNTSTLLPSIKVFKPF